MKMRLTRITFPLATWVFRNILDSTQSCYTVQINKKKVGLDLSILTLPELVYFTQWNKETANKYSCMNVSVRNVSHRRCNAVIDFYDTGSLDQSIIYTLLKLLQTERNNISKHKNQKG